MIQFTCAEVSIAGAIDGIIESACLWVFSVVIWLVDFFFLIDTRKITRLTLLEEFEFLGD